MKTIFFLILCSVASFVFGDVHSAELLGNNNFVGQKAPPVELKDISGKEFSLSTLKGKVVLLQFWASWCPPCIRDLPSLDKLQQTYKNDGFVVVVISTDPDSEVVDKLVKDQKIGLSVVLDTKREVKNNYSVFALPTSFLIDKKGTIVEQYIGEKDWISQESTDVIKKILKKK